MIDIPDDRGIYRKWLICRDEPANQFPKFLILPLNYRLYWIEQDGNKRYKRNMWCAIRMQSSYTNGSYVDKVFSRPDNQTKLWFSMNSITEKFWYSDDNDKNMRLIVSAPIKEPVTWRITKCENAQPLGIQKLTLYQDRFNEHTDYVNLETGEMYANYFDSEIAPTDPSTPTAPPSSIAARISASTSTIKVGGSYKNLTVNLFNDSNEDITTEYADATFTWTCSIDDEDWTDKVTWRAGTEYNQKKVKFPNGTSVIGKILSIKCEIVKDNLPIKSEILLLELTE